MRTVAVRLTRLEAGLPKPSPRIEYDLSRLTPEQMERMRDITARVDEVGLAGLTDEELDEAAAIAELMVPIEPSTEVRR